MTVAMATDTQFADLIERTWSDPDFKARLIESPRDVLSECGVVVPEGLAINVIENSETELNIVLPICPEPLEITDSQILDVSQVLTEQSTHPCCPYTKKNVFPM